MASSVAESLQCRSSRTGTSGVSSVSRLRSMPSSRSIRLPDDDRAASNEASSSERSHGSCSSQVGAWGRNISIAWAA